VILHEGSPPQPLTFTAIVAAEPRIRAVFDRALALLADPDAIVCPESVYGAAQPRLLDFLAWRAEGPDWLCRHNVWLVVRDELARLIPLCDGSCVAEERERNS
jgi:hypothetical protein